KSTSSIALAMGSGACATMMFLIFVLLYLGILHKAHVLVEENVMKKEAIEARLRMLHRLHPRVSD
ncbi:hypothetical protein, partial [Enterobacter hormaechei]|uniref:hypothetical protein n=1 Tax=Enterobacter hormaechei TaxID=158836 RepID=UPI001952A7A3